MKQNGMKANDRQVAGEHYSSVVQHWDYAAGNNFDYFQGQITKYVHRWKNKNGIEDLHKAMHFLGKYIELEEAKKSNFPEKINGRPENADNPFGFADGE